MPYEATPLAAARLPLAPPPTARTTANATQTGGCWTMSPSRPELRVVEMENAILRRAAAYFAREGSSRSYGSPRVHADLRLGVGIRCSPQAGGAAERQARICGI